MYERFTDRARKVMQLANEEAHRFNHDRIDTEHVLLGLVKDGVGVAADVLKNLDVGLSKVRMEVEKLMVSGPEKSSEHKLPMTMATKKVIEFAIEESKQLGHDGIGTEHFLLGLLREGKGLASQALDKINHTTSNLTVDNVRETVLKILGPPRIQQKPSPQ